MSYYNIVWQVFVCIVVALWIDLVPCANSQVPFTRRLSALRIKELNDLIKRLDVSLNSQKYPCESYYDYVCSNNQPLFSILGHQPQMNDLIALMTELQNDNIDFKAKDKLMDFFTSCNKLKSIDDCYRETFEYFKPIFGYIISKNYIDGSTHEYQIFMDLLKNFLLKSERAEHFHRDPIIRFKLAMLKEKFKQPSIYFRTPDLDYEYNGLEIYKETYKHNVRNLLEYRKKNSTYVVDVARTMLDWTLYIYQSRNKPMSYYYSTLNVHLWMTLYNSTERFREPMQLMQYSECLKLPQYVNALEEARILAVVYLKSFRMAWQDYNDWINESPANQEIFDQENAILSNRNHLNNQRLFFTFYAQNFCDFGKELAEHIFYLGLHQSQAFDVIYSCGNGLDRNIDCVA